MNEKKPEPDKPVTARPPGEGFDFKEPWSLEETHQHLSDAIPIGFGCYRKLPTARD